MEGPQEEARCVPADDQRPGAGTLPSAATLTELAEKLAQLRDHLNQVLTSLNPPAKDWTHERGDVAVGRRFRRSDDSDRRFRCRECGRVGSKDEAGWTLRLYGDDELHACCSDCDAYLSGNGA